MKASIVLILAFTFLNCTNSNNHNMGAFENKTHHNSIKDIPINVDTAQLTKTAEMLDEEAYWNIIDKSLKSTSTQDDQEQFLINELKKLTTKEIIGFRLRTDKLLYDTYTSDMWCAGYIMNGGCSDDAFEYFRNWVISRGKDTFYKAKRNPDSLISQVVDGAEFYEFESFWYVALEAFKHKTNKDLYDYIDDDNFKTREGNYPKFEFTWQEEKPDSMKKICPQLFAKLWH